MIRFTVAAFAVIALVGSMMLGLLPTILTAGGLGSAWPEMAFTWLGTEIFSVLHAADGRTVASVNPWVWVVAAVAELALMALWVTKPTRDTKANLSYVNHR